MSLKECFLKLSHTSFLGIASPSFAQSQADAFGHAGLSLRASLRPPRAVRDFPCQQERDEPEPHRKFSVGGSRSLRNFLEYLTSYVCAQTKMCEF